MHPRCVGPSPAIVLVLLIKIPIRVSNFALNPGNGRGFHRRALVLIPQLLQMLQVYLNVVKLLHLIGRETTTGSESDESEEDGPQTGPNPYPPTMEGFRAGDVRCKRKGIGWLYVLVAEA